LGFSETGLCSYIDDQFQGSTELAMASDRDVEVDVVVKINIRKMNHHQIA
jgi:hypothetical protein